MYFNYSIYKLSQKISPCLISQDQHSILNFFLFIYKILIFLLLVDMNDVNISILLEYSKKKLSKVLKKTF